MQLAEVYVRSQNVVTRSIGTETLIVPVRGGVGELNSIFSLNEVGSFIWEKLARPNTVEEIVDAVATAYAATLEDAGRDVERFLAEMRLADLVEATQVLGNTTDPVLPAVTDVQSRGEEISY